MLEPKHCYMSFEMIVSKGFNILKHCTNYVTLVLLLDMFELCQHFNVVVGKWILDSYFEHAVPLTVSCLHKCFIKNQVIAKMSNFYKVLKQNFFVPSNKNTCIFKDLMWQKEQQNYFNYISFFI